MGDQTLFDRVIKFLSKLYPCRLLGHVYGYEPMDGDPPPHEFPFCNHCDHRNPNPEVIARYFPQEDNSEKITALNNALNEKDKKIKELQNLMPHFLRVIKVSRQDSKLLYTYLEGEDEEDDGSFGDWMVQLDQLEGSIKELRENR